MISNFFPSEQGRYLYCRHCIKMEEISSSAKKKKKIVLELSYVQRTRFKKKKHPTLYNFQYTGNLSCISILIAKMPLPVLVNKEFTVCCTVFILVS